MNKLSKGKYHFVVVSEVEMLLVLVLDCARTVNGAKVNRKLINQSPV